jgi:hypothetical protein
MNILESVNQVFIQFFKETYNIDCTIDFKWNKGHQRKNGDCSFYWGNILKTHNLNEDRVINDLNAFFIKNGIINDKS